MRSFTSWLILPFLLFVQSVYADENTLTRLYQFLQADVFEASFTQRVYDEKSVLIDDSKGRFSVARPGRFRWEYVSPSRQIITSDGVNLINYDPELEQATVQPLTVSLGYAPIKLLLEKHPSLNDFTVDIGDHREGLDWITLTPKVQDIEFTRIELGLDKQNVAEMKMYDHFDQLTVIEFLEAKYTPLDENTFRLYLPQGTDVIGDYLRPLSP